MIHDAEQLLDLQRSEAICRAVEQPGSCSTSAFRRTTNENGGDGRAKADRRAMGIYRGRMGPRTEPTTGLIFKGRTHNLLLEAGNSDGLQCEPSARSHCT
jgi:hypothetical protein